MGDEVASIASTLSRVSIHGPEVDDGWTPLFEACRPARDDDESSVASMASSFSNISVQPSAHARQRAVERCITEREEQEAKKNGSISLAICAGSDEDMPRNEIRRWGARLVEAFDGVSLREPELRGSAGDRRTELVLAGSESNGQRIKQWLKDEGYFELYSKRMLYARRQEGDQELVVVEGLVASGVVGIITTFRRDKAGRETARIDATQADMLHLLSDGDDVDRLDELLRRIARLADGAWLVGPGHKLSEWPIDDAPPDKPDKTKSYPFLMWAAQLGRVRIVERLIQHYGCSVMAEQTVGGRGVGVTALHLAAYHGHVDVVRALLKAGADKNTKSDPDLYWDRLPIESARSGKEKYGKSATGGKLFPYLHTVRRKVALNKGANSARWARFDEIIELLDESEPAASSGESQADKGIKTDVGANEDVEDSKEFDFRPKKPQRRVQLGGNPAAAGIRGHAAAQGGGNPVGAMALPQVGGAKGKAAAATTARGVNTSVNPFGMLDDEGDVDDDGDEDDEE